MLTASCHCGAVRIDVKRKPVVLTQCNCSICRRYGSLWAYYSRKSVRVRCAPGAETSYLWNGEVLAFYHCNTCGCLTRYESVDKTAAGKVAVNARMMSAQEIAGSRVRTFDGAASWRYLD